MIEMGKHYELDFKLECIRLFNELTDLDEITIKKTKISNVRDLCKVLDISSYSLYHWIKELHDFTNSGDEKEKKFKVSSLEIRKIQQEAVKKSVLSLRFLGSFASALNISGYGKMSLFELKKAIAKVLNQDG